MITPRSTRLVRAPDLQAFREAVVELACTGTSIDARDRLVVVPTRAAAAHLIRSVEDRLLTTRSAVVLPDMVTPGEVVTRLAERLDLDRPVLTDAEREVLLGLSCRAACASGSEPPFKLRPGLVAEILRFFDALRLNQKEVDTFERLALGLLEPGASNDRGAERLVRQTRFLVAAFRDFERRCGDAGLDQHDLRRQLLHTPARVPFRHAVITVGDHAFEQHGLTSADWDLFAQIPGLERLDLVVTDTTLAGAFHERIHRVLPGIEEVRVEPSASRGEARLWSAPDGSVVHTARDREEEVAGFARRTKAAFRRGELRALDRAALVVRQPLPYVYVAREVLRSAGIPCQTFDTLPLAAEPFAAALDLVLAAVSSGFARASGVALLGSPHFRFGADENHSLARDIAALDRALAESGYLGELDALERLVEGWRSTERPTDRTRRARRAGDVLLSIVRELSPLSSPSPVAHQLGLLLDFLDRHETLPSPDDSFRARQLRSRGAIRGILATLRDAHARFDTGPVEFDETCATIRRWIEGHTFAPRAGDSGVHIVDAASAPFGDFDEVQLAGLVEGEWPDRPRRSIFYSSSILRELGWPSEADRINGARAAFTELLRLPAKGLVVSTFTLEADALVTPSPLLAGLAEAMTEDGTGLAEAVGEDGTRIFEHEALAFEPIETSHIPDDARLWSELRAKAPQNNDIRFRGMTSPYVAPALSLSALERYQDCAFKFFASDLLRLEEPPEDESSLSPRARGRFIHEVFQRFFEEWDRAGGGAITVDNIDGARELMEGVAERLLSKLPAPDASLERARLFGSAISVGIANIVLDLEASLPDEVQERWLEYRLEGDFSLGSSDRPPVSLKGVADRIDLLPGRRLRVLDYKSGSAPNIKRALQVPIYALCAQERLSARDGEKWSVDEAAYLALSGKRAFVPVIRTGDADADEVLAGAKTRLFNILDGIRRGEFQPRPHDPAICGYCAYSSVCRKDYVGDE